MTFDFYLGLPLLILLTVVQASILSRFPVLGVVAPLVFLSALAWGLLRGLESGLIWAFIGGFLIDLFSTSPLGASFLAMGAAIGVVILLQSGLPLNRILVPLVLVIVATPLYLLLYAILLRITGYLSGWQPLAVVLPTLLVSVVTMLPVYWLLYALQRSLSPRRVDTAV